MTAKLLLDVSLRILGIWLLLRAVLETAQVLGSYFFFPVGTQFSNYTWLSLAFGSLQLAVGVGIFMAAPVIASRVYADEPSPPTGSSRIGPGDLFQIANYVLGSYLLVRGIAAMITIAAQIVAIQARPDQWAPQGATAIVYTAAGLLLVFGGQRLANLVSLVRHDPDSIPQQQFSLKLLLGITVAVAVVLGIVRMATMTGP